MAEDKILENEQLDAEDLDDVAGGTTKEIKRDIRFFQDKGILPANTFVKDKDAIKNAFAKFGITVNLKEGAYAYTNTYSFNGKSISRLDALQIIDDKLNGK